MNGYWDTERWSLTSAPARTREKEQNMTITRPGPGHGGVVVTALGMATAPNRY